MHGQKVTVIGTGYVGLPAALMLAKAGYEVVGVDLNENIVRAINDRVLLIGEDELKALMADPVVHRNLRATGKVDKADIFIIAVPTPLHPRKKVADMAFVESALESLIPHLVLGNLIIIESTIPPLTCREMVRPMIEKATGLSVPQDVMLAHCPERILPGRIFHEIIHNDRIIGGMDTRSAEAARDLYSSFVTGDLLLTDDVTAELAKLMENTYRDVNIALSNEMQQVAEALGVDSNQVFELANRHPRVNYLKPGIGVGGHCIPIDPWFIKEVDPRNATLIEAARKINEDRPARIASKVRRALAGISNPKVVAVGAAYKPDTEDVRESPAMEIVRLLREEGHRIDHFDPLVEGMEYDGIVEVASGADLLLILVSHGCVVRDLAESRQAVERVMKEPRIWIF